MLALDGDAGTDVYRLVARQFFGTSLRHVERDGASLSLTRYPAETRQPWHTHENATLFLLIRGDFTDRSWTSETAMDSLSIVYHPTDEPHQSEAGMEGAVGLNIDLSPSWIRRRGFGPSDLGSYAVMTHSTARLAGLKLLVHAFSPSAAANDELERDLEALIGELRSARRSLSDKPAPSWLPAVESWLTQSLDDATGLRDAARAACVHPVYLARVFRAHYGCSVGEFIRRQRIIRAASYALQTDANLADAAHEARFADQSHFTRLFTRAMGVSPKVLLRIRASL